MADLITYASYKQLADYYAASRHVVLKSKDYLYDAVYSVVLFDELFPSYDLLTPTYNAYVRVDGEYHSPSSLLEAIRAINNHVISRGSYANVNEFLAVNNAQLNKLDTKWANMSAEAGYVINAAYYTDTIV